MEPATMASMVLAGLGVTSFGSVIGVTLLRTKFITKSECEKEQSECQKHICKELTNIQSQISVIDGKREKSREADLVFAKEISEHMGATNAFMKQHIKK